MTRREQMTVTVRVTDGWMVKALAKQIHTMKWNGRAPGVILEKKHDVAITGLSATAEQIRKAFERLGRVLENEGRRML